MNNCATCRWWVKREIDPDAPQKIRENCGALQDTPANRAFVQDCVELAEYNLKHGIGDCHGVPQIIEKSGSDFCGQWKGRGATRYFDEDGLIISEEEAKKRSPERFPQSDPYDGRKARIDYLCGRGGPMWADEVKP
jgi:hypothetical protein